MWFLSICSIISVIKAKKSSDRYKYRKSMGLYKYMAIQIETEISSEYSLNSFLFALFVDQIFARMRVALSFSPSNTLRLVHHSQCNPSSDRQ